MNFTDLNIKPCYESSDEDLVESFYEPVLSCAVKYDRIAGFFSSSSLAIAARGMSEFIRHGGQMRLLCCPKLSKEDGEMISRIYNDEVSEEELGLDLNQLDNYLEINHVKALGWMLEKGLLQMRLVIVKNENGTMCTQDELLSNGIFHQKVGVMEDSVGHKLTFSGSINESASAWVHNDEEFKVFGDWTPYAVFAKSDIQKFDDYWNGRKGNVDVIGLPKAIQKHLIDYSKDFDIDSISIKRYHALKEKKALFPTDISLFPYQNEALKKWQESNFQMLFEMATGTGKTRTAIAGMKYLLDHLDKLLVIIACPQSVLSLQWKREVESLGVVVDDSIIVDGTNSNWRKELFSLVSRNKSGFCSHGIIYTTHVTAASEDFIRIMTSNRTDMNVLFIGDEVHWLGAKKLRAALDASYRYRIGLSATPSRWFDDKGTILLEKYFNNASFQFTIHDALTTINPLTGKHFLVNYRYFMEKVSLNQEETQQYIDLTAKIVKLYHSRDRDDVAEKYERLIEKRANIIKNAAAKYDALSTLLDELYRDGRLENLIVFVSPEQIDRVLEIFGHKNVMYHRLTQKEGTKKMQKYGGLSEREFIIKQFKEKRYQALIAIKCLDEGIDIPSASRGILLSSGTNPREYVQRIGRIIRQDANKSIAELYDFVVTDIQGLEPYEAIERKIREKERIRLKEIAENAINKVDALQEIMNL